MIFPFLTRRKVPVLTNAEVAHIRDSGAPQYGNIYVFEAFVQQRRIEQQGPFGGSPQGTA